MIDDALKTAWKDHLGTGWNYREISFTGKRIAFDSTETIIEEFSKNYDKSNCWCGVYGLTEKPVYKTPPWFYDNCSIIDTIFFDFDRDKNGETTLEDVLKDVQKVVCHSPLSGDHVLPRVNFSGNKGFHVYVDMPPVCLTYPSKALEAFGTAIIDACKKYDDYEVKTLDLVGESARLSRLPFSLNIDRKTGERCYYCVPISINELSCMSVEDVLKLAKNPKPFPIIKHPSEKVAEYLKKFDLKVEKEKEKGDIERFLREVERKKYINKPNTFKKPGMRSCLRNALNQQLDGGKGHLIRLAIAWEMKVNNTPLEDAINAYKTQKDFNYKKVSYQVGRVYRDPIDKPFTCDKITKLGFCDQSCSKFKQNQGGW